MDGEKINAVDDGLESAEASSDEVRLYPAARQMRAEQYKVLDLVLEGKSMTEIAKAVNKSPGAISQIVNQPLFQNELAVRRRERERLANARYAEMKSQAMAILEEATIPAAKTQVMLLGSTDDRVKQNAVNAIFDRVYGKAMDRSVSVNVPLQVSPDKLAALESVLIELNGAGGVDVGRLASEPRAVDLIEPSEPPTTEAA